MADKDLRKTLKPLAQGADPRQAEFWQTEQNVDGSTVRQDRAFRYTGIDVTPTFSVAAEFDQIVRVITHEFPPGVVATLQAVLGDNSGTNFTDVVIKGMPVVVSAEQSVITIPFSGRFRFLFKDGWESAPTARISVIRQERIPEWEGGFALDWQRTGETQCQDGVLYWKEANQYGRIRWVTTGEDCRWVGTGELQCRADGLYEKQTNYPGDVRWIRIATDCGWVGTGELQCRTDGLYERERNRAGDYRWTRIATDCGWVGTGELQCRTDGLYERETNRAGDYRWTRIATDCGWVETGETECREDHRIWKQERNRAGDVRWTVTAKTCYDPTYPLPCGGWAFGPGDERPPDVIELTDCENDEGQSLWVYPTAGPGHTFPVYDCMADFYCLTPEDIQGYASNTTQTGIRNICEDAGMAGGCSCGRDKEQED